MTRSFSEAVANRRSLYALGNRKTVDNEKIREVVEFAEKHDTSAFKYKSARVLLLFGAESNRFWTLVRETLKKIVPADVFPKTAEKLAAFDAGLGTILFFEDQTVVDNLMASFPLYKDNFPVWSLESNGMLEFAVWTSLEDVGLGASLQHYNPLVDEVVQKAWNIPSSWKLLAEMPFGSVEGSAGDKEYSSIEDRVKVFG